MTSDSNPKNPYYILIAKPLIGSTNQKSKIKELLRTSKKQKSTDHNQNCNQLVQPEDGKIECNGPKCVYSCDSGFEMVGFSSKICINRMWKPQKPVLCNKIKNEETTTRLMETDETETMDEKTMVQLYRFCDRPKIPKNGKIDCKAGKCKFTCDDGYEINGFPSRMCVNKKWKPEKPVLCKKIAETTTSVNHKSADFQTTTSPPKTLSSGCQKPILENGITRCLRGGKSCQFVCNPGFIMTGSSQTYCNLSKTWSRAVPKCDIIENQELDLVEDDVMLKTGVKSKSREYRFGNCESLDVPKNGELDCAKNKCTFRCDEGYILEGYHTKICGKEGTWKPMKGVQCRHNGKFSLTT